MKLTKKLTLICAVLGLVLSTASAWADGDSHGDSHGVRGKLLASGLMGTSGGTLGPDGALYVTEGAIGQVTRVDIANGRTRTIAIGLPPSLIGLGGAIDVAFIGKTPYVLVTLVGDPLFGGNRLDGIYRIENRRNYSLLADLGTYAQEHPPEPGLFPYFLANGLQYALQTVDDGFLVSDGHHNRIYHVTLDGDISVVKAFGDVVPTGMAATADRVYLAETGAVPHEPGTGKVVSFDMLDPDATRVVAAGVSMIVDVEFGPHGELFALSQGDFGGGDPGAPASPNTGRLLRVNSDGSFSVIVDGLDRPTSLDFSCDTALVVTLTGEVWKYKGVGDRCDRDDD